MLWERYHYAVLDMFGKGLSTSPPVRNIKRNAAKELRTRVTSAGFSLLRTLGCVDRMAETLGNPKREAVQISALLHCSPVRNSLPIARPNPWSDGTRDFSRGKRLNKTKDQFKASHPTDVTCGELESIKLDPPDSGLSQPSVRCPCAPRSPASTRGRWWRLLKGLQ